MSPEIILLPLQNQLYSFLIVVASAIWENIRAAVVAILVVYEIDGWLQVNFFGEAIDGVRLLTAASIPLFFTVAVLFGVAQLMVSQLWTSKPVDLRKAVIYLILSLLYLQYGTQFWGDYVRVQREWSTEFMVSMMDELNNASASDSPFSFLAAVPTRPEQQIPTLTDNFSDGRIDGTDMVLAYALAEGDDVLNPGADIAILDPTFGLPQDFYDIYFPEPTSLVLWLTPSMTNDDRVAAISLAFLGVVRMLSCAVIIAFAFLEALVYLILTCASAIWMMSFGLAAPLSFFERTSKIMGSLIELGIQMFIFSIILGLIMALGTGMVILGAQTGNATILLGASSFFGMMMIILLARSFRFIGQSFNSFVTGSSPVVGELRTPGQLVTSAAAGVGGFALGVATGGVSLAAGASLETAAGAALGQFNGPYQASAVGQLALPDDSPVKKQVSDFFQGATMARAVPLAGGYLLAQQQQSAAAPSPTPAPMPQVSASSSGFSQQAQSQLQPSSSQAGGSTSNSSNPIPTVQITAADLGLAMMPATVQTAMNNVAFTAPLDGYTPQNVEQAVNRVSAAAPADTQFIQENRQVIQEVLIRKTEVGDTGGNDA